MDRRELGRRGEDAAAVYLEQRGMLVAARNWRCRLGEIDILAWDEGTLVVCEVKTRTTSRCGRPEESVTPAKQRRLMRLAQAYIRSAGLATPCVRFDVVSIRLTGPDRALLRHHADAFCGGGS